MIVIDRIDVRPVAARPRAGDVAELVRSVKRLDDVRAVRIENVEESEFVDDVPVRVHLGDHVANRTHVLAVGKLQVGTPHAQEEVPVLRGIECVREVVVVHRERTIPDFTTHEVVLHVALPVAPGEGAVRRLTESHHVAAPEGVADVVDGFCEEVPTVFARRVDDAVLRIETPFERAAHRVVPDHVRGFPREVRGVVEKVEAVFELRIDLHGFDAGKRGLLETQTLRFAVHGRGINVVRVVEVFGFAVEDARVFDAHFVHMVWVKSEDGHAAVRKQHATAHVVRNRDPAGLREHRHFGLFDHVAAVTDDGRQGRDLLTSSPP